MNCQSCGAPITFIRTTAGRNMPCDADPVRFVRDSASRLLFVTDEGETVWGAYALDSVPDAETGFTPHWASCPAADKWRKKRR